MLSEFDLIARYFTRPTRQAVLGVGDDCALLNCVPGMQLAISTDTLVEGRHFFLDADPFKLGYKCLAVNLSDLAAMGARPVAFTLALTLPQVDEIWLQNFSAGLFHIADEYGCELIGGDTTQGPRAICITVLGDVPVQRALRRDQAQEGDDIWVSGTLGEARLALAGHLGEKKLSKLEREKAAPRLHQPNPRVALGLALRGIAHAAIDVSDGLVGDLAHIMRCSQMAATLNVNAVPIGDALRTQDKLTQWTYALSGGDDYELCFTAPVSKRDAVLSAAQIASTQVTRCGVVRTWEPNSPKVLLETTEGVLVDIPLTSFDHFLTEL